MAGKTDKYKNGIVAFYSGKKGITQKSQNAQMWLDMINNPYLLLSLLLDRTWYFCHVAVAYMTTSVNV
jgi:hypothetical protein